MTTFDLHQGDALSYLRERVPDESVDVICTDPPYDSLEKHRKSGTTTRLKDSKASSNVWFPTMEPTVLLEHIREWLRVLKPGRHLYIFCDPETSYDIVPAIKAMKWRWGNRLIWNKGWIGMGYHYRRKYEDILFFTKAPRGEAKKRRLRNLGMSDVFDDPKYIAPGYLAEKGIEPAPEWRDPILDSPEYRALKGKGHYPTEKPVPLLEALIHQSAEPGELVLDPFMGSGSTGEAALRQGCRFLGIDIGAESIRRAQERLAETPGPEEGPRQLDAFESPPAPPEEAVAAIEPPPPPEPRPTKKRRRKKVLVAPPWAKP